MDNKIIWLISLVNDKCEHTEQLETLCEVLESSPRKYKEEIIVARTTMNSHYDYNLYKDEKFRDYNNHASVLMNDISFMSAI
jgi:hypothetical protein